MAIDVTAQTVIARSREEVASYAIDPDNDPVWISGITEAKTLAGEPPATGARVARVAKFLGRRIEYVLEVSEYLPESRLVMRSVKAPFPMEVTYEFEAAGESTLARIRIQGEAKGFYRLAGPVMSRAVKRGITNDLDTLKYLLESRADRSEEAS